MSSNSRLRTAAAAIALLALSAPACESDTAATRFTSTSIAGPNREEASERTLLYLDQRDFDGTSTTIDNRYLPLKPGTRYVYRGTDLVDGKRVPHRVDYIITDLTKVVDGVRTVVIWDRDYSRNQLVEAELTFLAQDKAGNVWHLGQYSEIYEGKELAGAVGFLAGYTPGARPGIMMQSDPRPNTSSFSEGWAPPPIYFSDRARVYRVGQKTKVPAGSYAGVVVLEEYSAKETASSQLKHFAPGIGNVRVAFKGHDAEGETLELVRIEQLDAAGLANARAEALEVDKRAKMYGGTPPLEHGSGGTVP